MDEQNGAFIGKNVLGTDVEPRQTENASRYETRMMGTELQNSIVEQKIKRHNSIAKLQKVPRGFWTLYSGLIGSIVGGFGVTVAWPVSEIAQLAHPGAISLILDFGLGADNELAIWNPALHKAYGEGIKKWILKRPLNTVDRDVTMVVNDMANDPVLVILIVFLFWAVYEFLLFCESDTEPAERIRDVDSPNPADNNENTTDVELRLTENASRYETTRMMGIEIRNSIVEQKIKLHNSIAELLKVRRAYMPLYSGLIGVVVGGLAIAVAWSFCEIAQLASFPILYSEIGSDTELAKWDRALHKVKNGEDLIVKRLLDTVDRNSPMFVQYIMAKDLVLVFNIVSLLLLLLLFVVVGFWLFCESDTEPAERIRDVDSPDPADNNENTTEFKSETQEENRQKYSYQKFERCIYDEASNSLCRVREIDDNMFRDMKFDTLIHMNTATEAEKLKKKSHEEGKNSHQESEQCSRPTDGTSSSQFGPVGSDLKKSIDIYDTRVTNDDEYKIYNVQTDEKLIPKEIGKNFKVNRIVLNCIKKIPKLSIVDGDYKETMARVKEIVVKMINRPLDDMEELEFRLCHLKKEHLKEFLLDEVLKACKISKLSIGFTENVTELIPSYCRIASRYKSTKLSLIFDDLKNEDIEALYKNLDENDKYIELDISYNRNIEPDGYKTVGKIVQKHEVRTLKLADCDISDEDLEYLFNGMGSAKLEVLDISCTNNATTKGIEHIGKQVAQKRIKRLKLSDTQLNVDTLNAFYNEVAGLIEDSEGQQVLLEEIDVSYNSTMEPEAYKVLGSMVKLFGVKKLSLAGCGLSNEHLKNLRDEFNSTEKNGQYTKMKSLNAGDNKAIGEGIVEIAKIVKECLLEELDISKCRLSANELVDFIKALENAKLKYLYLGEERQFDKIYISQVCNLLPHIEKMLRLTGTVRNNLRKMLQEKLDKLGDELEIKLDDDVTLRS